MKQENKDQQVAKARLAEAEETGCYGLLSGLARNLHTNEEWHAETAYKADGPFFCPNCFSDVVIRKCAEKIDHFAHKSRLSLVLGIKQMALHDACTNEICSLLAYRYPNGKWEVERLIRKSEKCKTPVLIPDISGRINHVPIAIEVQISALTIPRIVQRTRGYARRGVALIWIVPLSEPLGTVPFRPRLYERYLHSIYFGRTYYWWAGQGLNVKPVHYGAATRHIEYREWFADGQQESAGDYVCTIQNYKNSRIWSGLELG